VLAAAVFVPCFLIISWRGGAYFVVLVNYIALACGHEYLRLLEAKGIRGQKVTVLAGAVILPWLAYLRGGTWTEAGLALLVLASMAQELWRPVGEALVRAATAIFGVLYVAWLASHLVLLRELPAAAGRASDLGFEFVLLAFLLTWMSDTGAYAVGSLAGRHKLAPRISPGKSVEGSAGGLVFAVAAGWAATLTFLRGDLSPPMGAGLGALAAVCGQIGDLAESQLKRDARVKDASQAIPGHGGALDRFDSVLFAAPLIYYAVRIFLF
jgi:phosphatidate cytidylyltransferase